MTFYKLIDGANFIGVGSSCDLRKHQKKHNILLASDEDSAQYIQIDGMLFRDDWFAPVGDDGYAYTVVHIIVIDEEEYNALKAAVDAGEEIEIEEEEDITLDDIVIDEEDEDVSVEYVRSMKLASLSNICNKIITDGFDVELSDGDEHHFSLTIQDQLNLITLSTMVASGEPVIPYHADGELCKGYSPADITAIITAATEFKTYHVTYFNSLKAYVMSLDTILDISRIEYGSEIPVEYQSEVLRQMMQGL